MPNPFSDNMGIKPVEKHVGVTSVGGVSVIRLVSTVKISISAW